MKGYEFCGLCVLLIWAASGCTDKVDLDLPEGDRYLVVQGWISNDSGPQDIKLSYTNAYFDTGMPPLATGASVSIGDNEANITICEEVASGVYRYPEAGVIGKTYILNIILADGTRYQSLPELLFEPVPIDSIFWQLADDISNGQLEDNPDNVFEVLINTAENPGLGDYYQWRSFTNGEELRDPFDLIATSDEFVDGNTILSFNVTNELYASLDTVEIVQEKISKAAYQFLTTLQAQTAFVGGPFDTPPTPIKGNVLNLNDPQKNALGFFGAVGRDRKTVIVGVD